MEEISSPPYKYASVRERDDRFSRVGSSVILTTAINIALYKDFPATNKDAINLELSELYPLWNLQAFVINLLP